VAFPYKTLVGDLNKVCRLHKWLLVFRQYALTCSKVNGHRVLDNSEEREWNKVSNRVKCYVWEPGKMVFMNSSCSLQLFRKSEIMSE
jgi:hypothetical protein